MERVRNFQEQLSKKMRWISLWKDLQLAIKWVQVNSLDLYFSATLKSSASSGILGEWGLKQVDPRRVIPCIGPVSSKLCSHTKSKQDTKLNVSVVPVVIIWSCRTVYSPTYAGVAIISLDCLLISTVQPTNSQHMWMLRSVEGKTEERRLDFCWFVTPGTTQK